MVFAIHWHESAMDLHVFPIPIPPPSSLSIPSLWVFPVHQPKRRDIALLTKVHMVKTMFFFSSHVWMWEWDHREDWVPENRCFWTVVLEKTRVPWTRRWNQSILKEISHEYSLEVLMLKLNLQYFSHLMRRAGSLEKTLILGKTESRRRRGWQRKRWLDGITDSMDMSLSKLQAWWRTGKPGVLHSMVLQRVGHDWATEQQQGGKCSFHSRGHWGLIEGSGPQSYMAW